MEEIWKDVSGYEGLYRVSNLGRVKALQRTRSNGHVFKEKILKASLRLECGGYYFVGLTPHGGKQSKHYGVSRLVATEFCPRGNESQNQVNHKNGNKADNTPENLEWVTAEENRRHAAATGLCPRGSKHWKSVLDESKVSEIRSLCGSMSKPALAKKFGVSISTVYCVVSRRSTWATWRHVEPVEP